MNSLKYTIEGAGLWKGRLFQFDELPSTNRWARDHLDILMNGDVVWCKRQTAGRGRLNRTWLSPGDRGLALSVVIIGFDPEMAPLLGQMAALAIRNVLVEYGIEAYLKWPNDILVNGKKIAGILAETDFARSAVVLGIGLNVNMNENDLGFFDRPVTSMRIEKGNPFNIKDVRKHLLEETEKTIGEAVQKGSRFIIDAWSKYDWLKDTWVGIRSFQETVQGKYNGLDEQGRIRIIDERGRAASFWAGDVEKIQSV